MKIEFTKDFARNWKAGEIVEAKYLGMGEILVDNVAKVDAKRLLNHCKIVLESEDTDCDELSAVCVRSTEKEFEHLEWLLKNYYKKEPCEDCISRAEAQMEIEMNASRYTIAKECGGMGQVEWSDQLIKVSDAVDIIRNLPSVTPQKPKIGHWMKSNIGGAKVCSVCNAHMGLSSFNYCPNCGAKMVEPPESELENPFNDNRFGG